MKKQIDTKKRKFIALAIYLIISVGLSVFFVFLFIYILLFFQDSSFSRLLEPNQDKNEFKIVLVLFILGMSVGCGVGSKLWEMLMRKTKIISNDEVNKMFGNIP